MKEHKRKIVSDDEQKLYQEQVARMEYEGNFPPKIGRYKRRLDKRRRAVKLNSYKK